MCWANAPTLEASRNAFMVASAGMQAATLGSYYLLSERIERHGPVLDDDKFLAEICRVGPRTFQRKIRPAMEHLFSFDDGLVDLPLVSESVQEPETARRASTDPAIREKRRAAARVKWRNFYANRDANLQKAAAKSDAKSTTEQKILQTDLQPGAAAPAPAPIHIDSSLPLASPEEESLPSYVPGEGSGEGADATVVQGAAGVHPAFAAETTSAPETEEEQVARVALAVARLIPGRGEDTEVTKGSELYEIGHWLQKGRALPDGEGERTILSVAKAVAERSSIMPGSNLKYFKDPVLRAIAAAGQREQRSFAMVRTIEGGGAAAKPAEVPLSATAHFQDRHTKLWLAWNAASKPGLASWGSPFPGWSEFQAIASRRPDMEAVLAGFEAWREHGFEDEPPAPFWSGPLAATG